MNAPPKSQNAMPAPFIDPLTEIAYLRRALTLIGTECERYTGNHRCSDRSTGLSPYARYGDDRWCNSCIARTALTGAAFPARGAGDVEEDTHGDIIDVALPVGALHARRHGMDAASVRGEALLPTVTAGVPAAENQAVSPMISPSESTTAPRSRRKFQSTKLTPTFGWAL